MGYVLKHVRYIDNQKQEGDNTWTFSTLKETWNAAAHCAEYECEVMAGENDKINFSVDVCRDKYIEVHAKSFSGKNESHVFSVQKKQHRGEKSCLKNV